MSLSEFVSKTGAIEQNIPLMSEMDIQQKLGLSGDYAKKFFAMKVKTLY